MDWFTVEEIDCETYAISEYGHWEEAHSYLVCGGERAVLIDSGLGVGDIRREVEGLTSLPVTVLTTHVHWDHIGGHGLFSAIGVHEMERSWLAGRFPLTMETVRRQLDSGDCRFPAGFSVSGYCVYQGEPAFVYRDGDAFDLGGRCLRVIHTPGHSPGHCCFYEAGRRYLFSGDLIYAGCLDAFYPTTDPALFYGSVRKVSGLLVDRVLPGHHRLTLSPGIIGEIAGAFRELDRAGNLEQGKGLFDFGGFQIHI